MTVLTVIHTTTYRYRQPVRFDQHRLMLRPRDSHDLRLLDTALSIHPPAEVRWLHDTFSNSIAMARFSAPAEALRIVSRVRLRHYPLPERSVALQPYAQRFPFRYTQEDRDDLGRLVERHYPDDGQVEAWARDFVAGQGGPGQDTMSLLAGMTRHIRATFRYERRDTMGTQRPADTLALGSGTCRDYALLMIEAVRSLGLAARFVSGYLYDDRLTGHAGPDGETLAAGSASARAGRRDALAGGGSTHAWVQVFLPGAGWVEFDPTNALVGGRNLIRVAVTRDPTQAAPISGAFRGRRGDYLDLDVSVTVTAEPATG